MIKNTIRKKYYYKSIIGEVYLEGDVFGNGVNIASGIQAPGFVLLYL
jgi:hypothetical protein